ARRPTPDEITQTFFNGAWHESAVFFRENLRPGDKLTGPALISEPSSTIVVELGWDARVLDRGEVLLMSRAKSVRRQTQQALRSSTTGRLPQPQIERRVQAFREYLSSIHVGVNRDRALIAQEVFAFVGPFDEQQLLKNMAEHPKARHVARPRISHCLRQLVESGLIATRIDNGREVFEYAPVVQASSLQLTLKQKPSAVASAADPVLLEIFNNLFASIAEQMGVTLQKTSCSTNVKERLDFSCAIFDPSGNLVVNAPHIPVHLGAMSETVKRIIADNPVVQASSLQLKRRPVEPATNDLANTSASNTETIGGELQAGSLHYGDVFITNDPYRGGSHLPDVTVVTPVHDANGELIFFTASRAHHAEIGGIVPGSMPPFSKTLGEEGVLIRNFKLVDRGISREDELRQLLLSGPYPTRAVNDNMADIRAQVAANQLGVRQLLELVEKNSLPVVQAYMGHIQQAAATKMRRALAALADGQYQRTDHLDEGSPICVTITKQGDSATVDFTGTGPVLPSNLNANRAIVTAAVMYVFRCLINEDIPLNSGVMDP
ncbi:MAG TPA: hydantoinase B/oxoprolinase family protein, partial [Planctomycetaceae bacterium]|nr:hydantoinase B/oxoprolinase family protein [Planctomycetaceae bacterium]